MTEHRACLALVVALFGCNERGQELSALPPMHPARGFTAADVAGCYSIEFGEWSPSASAVQSPFMPPTAAALTLEPIYTLRREPEPPGRPVRYILREATQQFRNSAWEITKPNVIRIIWSDGHKGLIGDVKVDRTTRSLRGVARTMGGPRGTQSTAPLQLMRGACSNMQSRRPRT